MNRHPYPTEFIKALLETAERAKSNDLRWHYLTARLAALTEQGPSIESAIEMKAIVPQLCWLIQDCGGWFFGPGAAY